jgi:hypothetical protein
MIISQTPEEIKAALALQKKCELKRVVLRQSSASRQEHPETALTPPFSITISHNSVANEVSNGTLRIEGSVQVKGHDSSKPVMPVFNIECTFDLDYEIQDPSFQPEAESIAAFKDGNAIFNLWPYAREFVNNLTSRMELNAPALPLLRISPKKSGPDKQENTEPAVAPVPK